MNRAMQDLLSNLLESHDPEVLVEPEVGLFRVLLPGPDRNGRMQNAIFAGLAPVFSNQERQEYHL